MRRTGKELILKTGRKTRRADRKAGIEYRKSCPEGTARREPRRY